ncbi:unnamed protein product [Gongylonema pulchrum]|uniref:SH3 domain-containing protein n=1 Tax=Gongylonema pulchrum TaxID=637853 RepID=A0A183DFA9_9BILA|nr:unnamed protein product [Gongylonema pulchrum]
MRRRCAANSSSSLAYSSCWLGGKATVEVQLGDTVADDNRGESWDDVEANELTGFARRDSRQEADRVSTLNSYVI